MRPEFSEFSYGYAITEELVRMSKVPITAAPIFPSLWQEGQKGGGYDVLVNRNGIPLFLQFKCSSLMVRRTAKGFKEGKLNIPYFQIDLQPMRRSNQHSLLLGLEAAGEEVYYVAPLFHLVTELNQVYLNNEVAVCSRFVPPSTIGTLPDRAEHSWAFDGVGNACLLSKPYPTKPPLDFHQFSTHVLNQIARRGARALRADSLADLEANLNHMIESRIRQRQPDSILNIRQFRQDLSVFERISYLSRVFLDCSFFVVIEKQPAVP